MMGYPHPEDVPPELRRDYINALEAMNAFHGTSPVTRLHDIAVVYQEIRTGSARTGSFFALKRYLIELFGKDLARWLIELGRFDDAATWEWQIEIKQRNNSITQKRSRERITGATKIGHQMRDEHLFERVLAEREKGYSRVQAIRRVARGLDRDKTFPLRPKVYSESTVTKAHDLNLAEAKKRGFIESRFGILASRFPRRKAMPELRGRGRPAKLPK